MIKVAYDLSFVSEHYRRLNFEKFGIYQVAEQVLWEIIKNHSQTIDIAVTSICSKRLYDSFVGHSLLITDAIQTRYNIKFEPCFQSKVGKIETYFWLYNQLYSDRFQRKSSIQSLILRGMRKVLLYFLEFHQKWNLSYDFNIQNYDIFHSIYLGLPSKEVTGSLKRILTIHDLIPLVRPDLVSSTLIQDFRQNILNSILRDEDFIFCVSNYTKKQVCEYLNIDKSQVFVTPLGANSCFYPLKNQDQGLKEFYDLKILKNNIFQTPYFLGVASLEDRKNTRFLIQCFCDFVQSQPSLKVNLILVGSLPSHQVREIYNLNRKILKQSRGQILCTGYISDQELNLLYNQAIAFIFPSLYEGFGLPVLEALQCGTPVICSDKTSLPEVVGEAAILIDPQDPDTLKEAMLHVFNSDQLRSSLSLKAIKRAQDFSWKKCSNTIVEAYQRVSKNYC